VKIKKKKLPETCIEQSCQREKRSLSRHHGGRVFQGVFLPVFVFLLLCTWGCASRPSHFYILSPAAQMTPQEFNHTVLIAPVTIPSMADRGQLVTRQDKNQVKIDDFNLWAAPLKNEIARIMAENLSTSLNNANVITPGILPEEEKPYYRIQINVTRFEGALGEKAELDALWNIQHTVKGFIRSGKTTAEEPLTGTSYDALISAYDRLLGRLSDDIAQMLLEDERE
jgi:uncharacterized lipoprotein YmbA